MVQEVVWEMQYVISLSLGCSFVTPFGYVNVGQSRCPQPLGATRALWLESSPPNCLLTLLPLQPFVLALPQGPA
jgi:hypothetical protein